MNAAKRTRLLIENYVEARLSGASSGYDIRPVENENYEHYYILIQPKAGLYKDQPYILEMKTTYGSDSSKYPTHPPYIHFITNIFHVNVSTNGSICVDILKDTKKWSSMNSFDTIMQNILLLFDEPNNASPFNGEASKIWAECQKKYQPAIKNITSLSEKEYIQNECFELFINHAKELNNKNNYKKYSKWFPDLDKEHPEYKERIENDISSFSEAKHIYDEIIKKRSGKKDPATVATAAATVTTAATAGTVVTTDPNVSATTNTNASTTTNTNASTTTDPNVSATTNNNASTTTVKKNRWSKYQK